MNEQLKIIISAEVNKFKQGLANAKNELKTFGDRVKDAKKDVDGKMAAMGTSIKNAMKVGAVAIASAAAALIGMTEATREYRTQQAMLATAFITSGSSAEVAKETYNDLFRVLGDSAQATEAAQQLAMLTTEQEALSEWTDICQGVYATFGESLPIESLAEAANETAKTGELTGALADALNWAGINEEEFKDKLFLCNTEAEREALIRQTLSGLYSDAASNYENTAKSILEANDAQRRLTDATAAVGTALEPVMTTLKDMGASVLEALAPLIQDFAENQLPKIRDILGEVGEKLKAAFEWAKEHETLLGALAVAVGVIVTAIGLYNAVAAIKAAMDAAQVATIWGLVAAHTAQAVAAMAALAPYILIVAAIAAVIAIIVLCVKHWDEIVAAVKNFVDKAVAWIKDMASKIGGFFSNLWENIKNIFGKVGSWFSNVFTSAWNGIKNAFSKVSSFFKGIWDSITSIFKNVGTAIGNAISGTVKKAVNGVLKLAVGYINGFISAINLAIGIINAIPGVNIKKINKLDVPQLAHGGVLKKGQIGLLEGSGAEAVVPLEKNTEWINKVAAQLGGALGAGTGDIVLQVDGNTFGRISKRAINQHTLQTGKLDLVFA